MPLIVMEGVDSSGKETQVEKLYLKLLYEGRKVKRITFPNYKSEASSLVKMYLNGEFGSRAEDVNPFAASAFYAVDRFASYKKYWKKYLDAGEVIIADRYTSSNLIYQGAKFSDLSQKDAYLDWALDFEYNKMGLPKPDLTLFLDMSPSLSIRLMQERSNKITGRQEKDIHEKDNAYIRTSYDNARYILEKYGWTRISCQDEAGELKPISKISDEIYSVVKEMIV